MERLSGPAPAVALTGGDTTTMPTDTTQMPMAPQQGGRP